MRPLLLSLALLSGLAAANTTAPEPDPVAAARQRWEESPHGPMLARILPPGVEAARLPEAGSEGAALALRYCVQCHNLPNPQMHTAERWDGVLDRMIWRMRGKGNMGTLMTEMMAGVKAPSDAEQAVLEAYFARNAQKALDPARYPDLQASAEGRSFKLACSQCHALPDPQRYKAEQWPAVVERMKRHMAWANVVRGTRPIQGEPQLRSAEIVAFLQRHSRSR